MAKYKHNEDTKIVLEDIKNRLIQLQEANEAYRATNPVLVEHQNTALQSAQMVVQQAIDTGHVFRGSWAVPDGLLEYSVSPSPEKTLNASVEKSNEN